jgi:hypothetical protein
MNCKFRALYGLFSVTILLHPEKMLTHPENEMPIPSAHEINTISSMATHVCSQSEKIDAHENTRDQKILKLFPVDKIEFAHVYLPNGGVLGRYCGGEDLSFSPLYQIAEVCPLDVRHNVVSPKMQKDCQRLVNDAYPSYCQQTELYGLTAAELPNHLPWKLKLNISFPPSGVNIYNFILSGWLFPTGTKGDFYGNPFYADSF